MRRERIVPLIVGASLFMEHMDSTVISTSLPNIAADIGTSPLTLKLAVTSYLLSLAVFIPASGWFADRFGARTVFTSAIGCFILGSIGCAISHSIESFVIARLVQGMGGAMMTPVGRLVLLRTFDKRELVNAMTWVSVPALIGPIIGPALGGFITTYASWHWIFLINIPIGLLGVLLAMQFMDPVKSEDPEPFDFKGFVLSGIGLSGIAFGLSVVDGALFTPTVIIATLVCGAISMTLYTLHARNLERPVLDFRLLKNPTMRNGLLGGILFRAGSGASPFLLPLLLQIGFGMTPFQSGSITFVTAFGALGMKGLVTKILKTYGFRRVMVMTSILGAIGIGLPAFFTPKTSVAIIMCALFFAGFMRSLQFSAINALVYADVEKRLMSRATTLVSVALQMAVCAGVAVGALCVEITLAVQKSDQIMPSDFIPAFCVITLIASSAAILFQMMPADAGHQVSGHHHAPKPETISEMPPETEAEVLSIENDAARIRERQAS
jgi:EmrB/QacA subfamily drug resistance transporter